MIEVVISKREGTLSLRLVGHAGYAERGKDIICASASILVYTVAQMMADLHEQGRMQEAPFVRLDEGDAAIRVKPNTWGMADASHAYLMAQTGFELLQSNYPEYLQLTKLGEALKA